MGNIQTNKVDNIRNKQNAPEQDIQYELASSRKVMQLNRENIISKELQNDEGNKVVFNSTANRYLNLRNLQAVIKIVTWYRDSHGLFDYEEQSKITNNDVSTNTNFILKRENENIISEHFQEFAKMRLDQEMLREVQKEEYQKIVAACFFKDNNFWIFHKETIEDSEEEKANPGDKLWIVLRHMQADREHNFEPNKGYKLELGDTIKFGRVRYKVIMMQNEKEGRQEYALFDRFQKKKHQEDLKKLTGYEKNRRRNSIQGVSSRSPSPTNGNAIGGSPQRSSTVGAIPRYQSQATQFENGAFDRDSFYQEGESLSQDMGDSDDESSNYTVSQVSERGEDDISDMNTVQQNGSMIILPNENELENSVNLAVKNQGPNLSFALSKFNSVAPIDVPLQNSDREIEIERSIHERRVSHQTGIRDTTGLGKTSIFFSGPNNLLQSQASGLTDVNMNRTQKLSNLLLDQERAKRRNKKYKKSQKQKLLLKLQLAERAKLALDGKVCRICLGEENGEQDPLISPCKCSGTMSHIHLECLREWLNSKKSRKDGEYVKTYCWKALECELCQQRFPGQVFPDGTIVSDKMKLSQKQIKKLGKPIEILDFDRPDNDYIVIESVTLQNIRIIHVISMKERQFIRVGRGHDADIRVTDISVSRFHAKINRSEDGQFYVEDNKSKFGTLIQVRKPLMLDKNRNNYIQMGRSTLQIRINDDYGQQPEIQKKSCCSCFQKEKNKKQNIKEISRELYPKEWNLEEKEDEEDYLANTQIIEQTGEGEEEGPRSQPSMRSPPIVEIEEIKDNQIIQRESVLEEQGTTPLISQTEGGLKTGLEKNSQKIMEIDFGAGESSIIDSNINDQTNLLQSPQKSMKIEPSRNNNGTNLITPIKEVPQDEEQQHQMTTMKNANVEDKP